MPFQPPRRRRRRLTTTIPIVLALLAGMVAATMPAAAAEPAARASGKVERQVLDALASAGTATFFVMLRDEADLSAAASKRGHAERAGFVLDRLRATAERSQAGLRSLLRSRHADFTPFWIANAVKVRGDAKLLDALAARPEVARVVAERSHQLPKPTPAAAKAKVDAVEWGIDRIRAPEVWSTFGDRGEGIVVANVDTGVQFDHPALVAKYRGNLGNGTFDHNYNWFDPSSTCGSPSLVPCDNAGHGTHTMGTMVGDDGDPGANQIGVAPHARWIAAKGCESTGCSDSSLLASGQWILAPTDLNNLNPRPDLAPHVVNNSWGGGPNDPFYQAIVDSWVAAGIFPAFSNGNAGPDCGSAGSPGDFTNTYSAGAFDVDNVIADFSSRGPAAAGGELKPNLAAPGVAVRSSVPGSDYDAFSGTSMASPHVAATVALMWSAAPSLIGQIDATRQLLDDTAIDTADDTCGGTADDNNVFGEGRLDAFAAVQAAPRGQVGTLAGTITDASTSQPLAGASVHLAGPSERTLTTGADGRYSANLSAGTYTVEATRFGYQPGNASVEVPAGATATADLALVAAARQQVSGHVTSDTGAPVGDATVSVPGAPIAAATTDADGAYTLAGVPAGEYDVTAAAGRCFDPQTAHLVVDGDETLDFTLPQDADAFGYRCAPAPFAFIDANTPLAVSGDDASTQVALPFRFPFYGKSYEAAHVSTNGVVNFLGPNAAFSNVPIPNPAVPNAAAYAFWDDLVVDDAASVRTELVGDAPNRRFAIEWRNVRLLAISTDRVTFEAVLHENGKLVFQYKDISDNRERGNSATIGIEDEAGAVALQYANSEPVLDEGSALLFSPPPSALARGTVTDANDHLGVAGATVKALHGDEVAGETTTDGTGAYQLRLPLGSYTLQASATNYQSAAAEVTLDQADEVVQQDFSLATAAITVQPASLELAVRPSQLRSTQLTIGNSGGLDLTWQLSDNAPWLSVGPASGRVAPGGTRTLDLTVNTNGLAPGTVDATITIRSSAGRAPTKAVGFRLVVPRYQVALNAGGGRHVDRSGAPWSADRAWSAGGAGYVGGGQVVRSSEPIQRTDDDPLYQDQRVGAVEYRFDGLAPGVYQVELRFAELEGKAAGARVFDVQVEGATVLAGLDVTAEASRLTADEHTLFVSVGDRQLNLRLVPRTGQPILNAIRVTSRPDRAA